jgi:hypothetical protein
VAEQATIRLLADTDSLDELTELLHRAYAPLGARGLTLHGRKPRCRADAQARECYVLVDGSKIVGIDLLGDLSGLRRDRARDTRAAAIRMHRILIMFAGAGGSERIVRRSVLKRAVMPPK